MYWISNSANLTYLNVSGTITSIGNSFVTLKIIQEAVIGPTGSSAALPSGVVGGMCTATITTTGLVWTQPGAVGTVLTSNGAGAIPTYDYASSGRVTLNEVTALSAGINICIGQ